MDLIPGQGTEIPHEHCDQKKPKTIEIKKYNKCAQAETSQDSSVIETQNKPVLSPVVLETGYFLDNKSQRDDYSLKHYVKLIKLARNQ